MYSIFLFPSFSIDARVVRALSRANSTSSISDFRIAILWTDQTGVTDGTQAITTASEAYREYYADCNLVSLEKSMDLLSTRGVVPVLKRFILKPSSFKLSERLLAGGSAHRPAGCIHFEM